MKGYEEYEGRRIVGGYREHGHCWMGYCEFRVRFGALLIFVSIGCTRWPSSHVSWRPVHLVPLPTKHTDCAAWCNSHARTFASRATVAHPPRRPALPHLLTVPHRKAEIAWCHIIASSPNSVSYTS